MASNNAFAGAKTAAEDSGVEDDFLRSGGALDTDIYPATIKACYTQKARNTKAMFVITLLDVGGREVRSQILTNNKSGGITYKDQAGKDKNLPGYNQMNTLALLLTGKELGSLDVEEKTLKLYDFDAKKELPQAVDCFVELHGMKVQVALQKQIVDKTKLNEKTNEYDPTGETREVNEVIKYFPEDKLVTMSEIVEYIKSLGAKLDDLIEDGKLLKAINKMPNPDEEAGTSYAQKWLKSNHHQTYDRSTGAKGGKGEGRSFDKSGKGDDEASGERKKKTAGLFDD